jgi:hypothetical protein
VRPGHRERRPCEARRFPDCPWRNPRQRHGNFWDAYSAHRLLGNYSLAAAFIAFGLYQILRGNWFGSAVSLLFYSLLTSHLAKLESELTETDVADETPPERDEAAPAAAGR